MKYIRQKSYQLRKKIFTAGVIFILLSFLFRSTPSYASHAAGGELLYEWVSDSTYHFVFKFYRDCSGIAENNFMTLCAFNSCANQFFNLQLNKTVLISGGKPNGTQLDVGCPGYKNSCDSVGSKLPGFREWWYEGTTKLTGKCNLWRFSVSIGNRNGSINLMGQPNFYVESTLNNLNVAQNSSASFFTKPVPYVCLNSPYSYNNGAIDIDKDSLVFQTVVPMTGGTSSCTQPGLAISFSQKTPALNLPTNPFQTNNSYSTDRTTGKITFTPTELGAQTTAILVQEYRKGILVGSTMRDIQIQVLPCTNSASKLDVDTLSIVNASLINGVLEACINKPFSFCFKVVASDKTALLAVSDNKNILIPAASLTFTNNATDSVTGCFTWFPQAADSGLKILTITAKDSTCRAPGISISQTFTIPVNINTNAAPPSVVSPLNLCQYSGTGPLTATGYNLLWYNVPVGGTGSSTAPVPNTNTVGNTTYYVSQTPNGCVSPRVPLTVSVSVGPQIDLDIVKDTICTFEPVTIKNKIVNTLGYKYLWSSDSSKFITPVDSEIAILSWKTPGPKTVRLSVSGNACTATDSATVEVINSPTAFFSIAKNVCVGKLFTVEPLEQDASYHWKTNELHITDTVFKPKYNVSLNTVGKRIVTLTVTGANNCATTYTDSVDVHGFPSAKISFDPTEMCLGKQVSLHAEKGFRYEYAWDPPQYFLNNSEADVTAVAERTGYIHLTISNQWKCTSVDSFLIQAPPCCDIFMPGAFTPNNDGHNDTYRSPDLYKHTLVSFIIANRRGEIVFNTTNINQAWDGTFKGKESGMDTYNYYIKYICNDTEEMVKKGTLMLLR